MTGYLHVSRKTFRIKFMKHEQSLYQNRSPKSAALSELIKVCKTRTLKLELLVNKDNQKHDATRQFFLLRNTCTIGS